MWRAREKELELESKMKGRSSRSKDHDDSRGKKRKSEMRNHSSSSRVEQEGITYSNSYSDQEDGLRDDEIERFLQSRSVMIFGIFFSFHFSRWRHVTKYSFYSGDLMKSM